MCGIAGVFQLDEAPVPARILREMVGMIRHRGPDAAGVHIDNSVGLAHARLSIIDLRTGNQPMCTDDQSLVVTFNGEIYNYVELRERLAARGHYFRTQSDTEVILHAYREYGENCVHHFNGQWAFAIWDRRQQRLFLSRDRFGIRPLYYTQNGTRFSFASEVKSLFVDPGVSRELDPGGLTQLFTFWATTAPTTVFRGVSELPPGHNLVVQDGGVVVSRFWDLPYEDSPSTRSSSDLAEELRTLLLDATRLRLRADVSVGTYLSGGLDSSVTTALAKQIVDGRLRTFSVTFDDDEFDESDYQRQSVEFLDVDHQSVHCRHEEIGRVFPEVVWHAEKPMLRTAPAPLFLLSRRVHDANFKVVLTGEGSDEVLGGYDIFKEAKIRRFIARQPESSWRGDLLRKLYPYLPGLQAQSVALRSAFFRAGSESSTDPLFSHRPRWNMTAQIQRLFAAEFLDALPRDSAVNQLRCQLPHGFDRWHSLSQAQYLEATGLLPGYILSTQGDRMAMAHSVEGRFPFLDHRIAEFAARIPPRLRMKGLNEKYLLKRATESLVPTSVTRRTKQPYRAPDAKCFFDPDTGMARHEYVEYLLAPAQIERGGVFQSKAVARLLEKVKGGRATGTRDNMALIGILSTQLVLERFVHEFSPARVPVPVACNGSLDFVNHSPAFTVI